MTDLVLVHGGFGGAWYWEPLLPHLRAHRVLAVDLLVDVPGADVETYAQVVLRSIASWQSDAPVLIGHSLGSTVISRVPLARPVTGLIHVCPGLAARDATEHAENRAVFGSGLRDVLRVGDDGFCRVPEDAAIGAFFNDVPIDLAQKAARRLRPQWAGAVSTNLQPLAAAPDVPQRAILCREDPMLRFEELKALVQRRFGHAPYELPGGHSPMLAQPGPLAALIERCLDDFTEN